MHKKDLSKIYLDLGKIILLVTELEYQTRKISGLNIHSDQSMADPADFSNFGNSFKIHQGVITWEHLIKQNECIITTRILFGPFLVCHVCGSINCCFSVQAKLVQAKCAQPDARGIVCIDKESDKLILRIGKLLHECAFSLVSSKKWRIYLHLVKPSGRETTTMPTSEWIKTIEYLLEGSSFSMLPQKVHNCTVSSLSGDQKTTLRAWNG